MSAASAALHQLPAVVFVCMCKCVASAALRSALCHSACVRVKCVCICMCICSIRCIYIACITCRYKKKNTGADINLNCFRTMSAMFSLRISAMYAALTSVVELGSCAPGTYATRQWMFLPVNSKFMRLGRALERFSRHTLREGEMTPVLR